MLKYIRYCLMFPILLASILGLMAGGPWMWSGLCLCLVLVVGGDELLPEDPTLPSYRYPRLLNVILFSTMPFIALHFLILIWMCAPAGDPFRLAATVREFGDWNLLEARDRSGPQHLLGAVLSTVLMTGVAGINMAHELMHRNHPAMKFMSRLLQVFSYDVPGHISHLNAHHVKVGMHDDPSTGRRGESSYAFVVRAIVAGNLFCWAVETARLRAQGKRPFSWHNRFIQGHALSVAMTAVAWYMSGWRGAVVFVVTALLSKALLELVNYVQHYGLVRAEGAPIAIRHSWNSNKRMSTYLLCNVTRHSYHHVEPALPFWGIEPAPNAPTLRFGYLSSILLALVPALWHRLMAQPLRDWDERHANPEERRIAMECNRRSGVRKLVALAATEQAHAAGESPR